MTTGWPRRHWRSDPDTGRAGRAGQARERGRRPGRVEALGAAGSTGEGSGGHRPEARPGAARLGFTDERCIPMEPRFSRYAMRRSRAVAASGQVDTRLQGRGPMHCPPQQRWRSPPQLRDEGSLDFQHTAAGPGGAAGRAAEAGRCRHAYPGRRVCRRVLARRQPDVRPVLSRRLLPGPDAVCARTDPWAPARPPPPRRAGARAAPLRAAKLPGAKGSGDRPYSGSYWLPIAGSP